MYMYIPNGVCMWWKPSFSYCFPLLFLPLLFPFVVGLETVLGTSQLICKHQTPTEDCRPSISCSLCKHTFGVQCHGLGCQGCALTKVKNPEKMGSGRGSPIGLEDKAPWTSRMFTFGGFTDSPHPHKQETRWFGHNTGYFFLSLVATSLLSRKFWGKGRCEQNSESGKILENPRPGYNDRCSKLAYFI